MQIDDCSVTTVIDGVNYCIVLLNQNSWADQLNNLPPEKVAALLSATALIWYVAGAIRTHLRLLGSDDKEA
ncbi:hypothetical protein [Acinetobacter sp. ANC5681]|uniref:hypothetical protein n=1 Tax=Acinetobacter sp. ANC5681 TaxID=2929504 RepID=UPI00201AEFE0|nr:hypothetical protein [Acinetobacter sp. ANC5681]MCL5768536.1 hypothetical protein [Acinetobacter sp. ANC5681]MCL5768546.1 hypothetical protein [Acinetobacter sp. ANC5681]